MCGSLLAQEITVSGTVTTERWNTLPGVTIVIKENLQRVRLPMAMGKYTISVLPNQTLEFSFVGMETQDVPLRGVPKLTL
jgi:hypothetical protein